MIALTFWECHIIKDVKLWLSVIIKWICTHEVVYSCQFQYLPIIIQVVFVSQLKLNGYSQIDRFFLLFLKITHGNYDINGMYPPLLENSTNIH